MSMELLFIRPESPRIMTMDIIEPANDAPIRVKELTAMPRSRKNIMARATVSFAPEEIPSTKGVI